MLSRVGKMLPSLSGGGLYGAGYPAGQVLGGETSGFAIDFTSPGANLLMRSGTIPGNYVGYPFVREGGPVAFSRASNATVTDADGKIKWAAHNLLTNSESFDAATWTKSAATVSANVAATTAPNSTSTADKIAEDATTASHRVQQGFNATIGATYTLSVFAKAAERSWLQILTNSFSSGNQAANFNLSNGTVGTGATGANLTKTITSIGSGWYLCTITWTPDATGSNVYFYILDSDAATGASYTGVSGNGIYLWGAHLYRSDLGGMVANTSAYPYYNPTTPKNLLGYTEDFSNAAWSRANIAAFGSGSVANAAVAPNGLQTADLLVPDTTSAAHTIFQSSTVGGLNVQALYVKPAGYNKIALRESQTGAYYAAFNLAGTGSVLDSSGATATITALSDGWYRISMIGTISGTTRWSMYFLSPSYTSGSVISSWTPDGTSGIYLWGAQLSDSASLDTYVPNNFAAPTAAAYYGPRLDYDGSTLAAKGLLVEEQRSNVVLLNGMTSVTGSAGSQYPNATGWANEFNTGGTRTYVASNAVPGFNAIDISNVSNARNLISFSFSAASSTTYSVSFYIESLNGVTGAISYAVGALGTGGTSNIISSPTSTGRVSYTFTTGTGAGTVTIRLGIGVAQNQNGSIRISGLQVEAGSFSTSLIPTTSASVTRSADVAQVSTQAFPYSGTEGSIVVSARLGNASATAYLVALSAGAATTNSVLMYANPPSSQFEARVNSGGITQAAFNNTAAGTPVADTTYKYAVAYKADDFAATINGTSALTDTSGSVPSAPDTLNIGMSATSTLRLNGHIRQITYIPRRLTNAELQSRTA